MILIITVFNGSLNQLQTFGWQSLVKFNEIGE